MGARDSRGGQYARMRRAGYGVRSQAPPDRLPSDRAPTDSTRGGIAALDPLLVRRTAQLGRRVAEDDRALRPTGPEPHLSPRTRRTVLRPQLPGCAPPVDHALGAPSG